MMNVKTFLQITKNQYFTNNSKKNIKNRGLIVKNFVFLQSQNMAIVAQLVRVPDCGSVGRRFESDLSPKVLQSNRNQRMTESYR